MASELKLLLSLSLSLFSTKRKAFLSGRNAFAVEMSAIQIQKHQIQIPVLRPRSSRKKKRKKKMKKKKRKNLSEVTACRRASRSVPSSRKLPTDSVSFSERSACRLSLSSSLPSFLLTLALALLAFTFTLSRPPVGAIHASKVCKNTTQTT